MNDQDILINTLVNFFWFVSCYSKVFYLLGVAKVPGFISFIQRHDSSHFLFFNQLSKEKCQLSKTKETVMGWALINTFKYLIIKTTIIIIHCN